MTLCLPQLPQRQEEIVNEQHKLEKPGYRLSTFSNLCTMAVNKVLLVKGLQYTHRQEVSDGNPVQRADGKVPGGCRA